MKILLPFNLLPDLEDTGIASCFGLKNRYPENHTLIELSLRDAHDLLTVLRALEAELHARCQRWQKQASKSPISVGRRTGIERRLQVVRCAVELMNGKLDVKLPDNARP